MKVTFSTYTKKELIAMIERDMNENDVAVLSTAIKEMDSKPKLKLTNLTFQFPHEMIAQPDNVLHLLSGSIVSSLIIVREPKKKISKMYLDGLKKNDGVFGFSVEK
jgi:hypothetical protein